MPRKGVTSTVIRADSFTISEKKPVQSTQRSLTQLTDRVENISRVVLVFAKDTPILQSIRTLFVSLKRNLSNFSVKYRMHIISFPHGLLTNCSFPVS